MSGGASTRPCSRPLNDRRTHTSINCPPPLLQSKHVAVSSPDRTLHCGMRDKEDHVESITQQRA